MKWLLRALVAIVLLVAALASVAYLTALRTERPVGFQAVRAIDAGGRPFAVGVWYPTDARPWPTTQMGAVLMSVARGAAIAGDSLPLIVISHGNGGGPPSHADLAMALASEGYIVAAPMHPGDNFADQSGVGSATFFHERTRQLRATLDQMLATWQGRTHIDPARIGAFGFSAGGFTVLAAVGAQPDLRRVATHCANAPEFACEVLRSAGSPLIGVDRAPVVEPFVPDARIGAAVVAAPGLGFTMDSAALAGIHVPLQLWSGEADDRIPYATNIERIRDALGAAVEYHAVPGAGHYSFLAPCGLIRPPGICADAGDFDRKAFHARMNASVVQFFDTHLKGRR